MQYMGHSLNSDEDFVGLRFLLVVVFFDLMEVATSTCKCSKNDFELFNLFSTLSALLEKSVLLAAACKLFKVVILLNLFPSPTFNLDTNFCLLAFDLIIIFVCFFFFRLSRSLSVFVFSVCPTSCDLFLT